MNFCNQCGAGLVERVPEGDHVLRHVCSSCGSIHYRNPKVIVGCVPAWGDQVLMCRRAIEPRRGRWTFPAGFLELAETTAAGAARETLEEAQARVEIGRLFVVIGVPYVSQIYLIHHARLLAAEFGPTVESSEVRLMKEEEIPWDEIAFPTIWHSLKYFFEDRAAGREGFHTLDLTSPPRRGGMREVSGAPV